MRKFKIKVDEEEFIVEVEELGEKQEQKTTTNKVQTKSYQNTKKTKTHKKPKPKPKKPQVDTAGKDQLTAPMPGKILAVKVKEGQQVEKGDLLVILEAMKLENNITAPYAAKIKEIKVEEGKNVESGEVLINLE